MKATKIVPKRSFNAGPLPQKCEDFVKEERNSLKHHSHDAGVEKHILEPESCGNSNSLEESDRVTKGATSSSVSPPHEGNKGEMGRYKYGSKHIAFDFVKHGKRIACSFCGLDNHYVSRCWKRMATYRKLLKEKKQVAKVT